jgi:hypothetical protein
MVFPFEKLPFSLSISRQDYEKAMAKMAKKVGRIWCHWMRISLDVTWGEPFEPLGVQQFAMENHLQ